MRPRTRINIEQCLPKEASLSQHRIYEKETLHSRRCIGFRNASGRRKRIGLGLQYDVRLVRGAWATLQVLWPNNEEASFLLCYLLVEATVSTRTEFGVGAPPAERSIDAPTESPSSLTPIDAMIAFVRRRRTNPTFTHIRATRFAATVSKLPAVLNVYHLFFLVSLSSIASAVALNCSPSQA